MEVRVLGPMVALSDDGSEIPLGGPKERSILALLLVSGGEVIATDRMIEQLWPESPPEASRKTVQAYVSRLRGRFAEYGADSVIRSRPNGYLADPHGHKLDVTQFESAMTSARSLIATEPDEAARSLRQALELWRGRPFEDTHPTPELELEAARLEEQRLAALETWAEAELAAGRHRDVVADLRRITEEHPLREGLWRLLMLALYRSGRQAEALRTYAEVSQVLAEQLGIEPSRELADLERRVLLQDPGLEAPRRGGGGEQPTGRRRHRKTAIVVATIAVIALSALAAFAVMRSPSVEDGPEPRLGLRHPVAEGATQIIAAAGRVWVLDPAEAAITAFDPRDESTTKYDLPAAPSSMAAGMGSIWVASTESGSIMKVDASTGALLGTADGLDLDGAALAVGADAVWVIREHPRPFLEVDPLGLEVEVLSFVDSVGGPAAPRLAVHGHTLWGSNSFIGRIMSLDPESGSFDFAGDPRIGEHAARSILSNKGAIWFSQPTNGSVTRVDAESGEVTATVDVGRTSSSGFGRVVSPYGLAAGPGGVWVALPRDGKVLVVDDDTAAMVAEVGFDRPVSVTAATGGVWVLDDGTNELVELLPGSCTPIPFIGPGADLRGCDLSQKVLVGVDLTGADLRWADLRLAAIQSADLARADLYGADLGGAALDFVTWDATRCPDGTLSDQQGGRCAN